MTNESIAVIIGTLIAGFALAGFSPMFAKHDRWRKRLKGLKVDGDAKSFSSWRRNVKASAACSDAAACCFVACLFIGSLPGSASAHIFFPFMVLFLLSIALPPVAWVCRKRAYAVSPELGLPTNLKWLGKKDAAPKVSEDANQEAESGAGRPQPQRRTRRTRRRRDRQDGTAASGVKWRRWIFASVIGIVMISALTFGLTREPNPNVSGKPLRYWVKRLEDADPAVVWEAFDKIQMVPASECHRARHKLLHLANESELHAGNAALMLFQKFGETRPEWAPLLIPFIEYSGPGRDAIEQLYEAHPDEIGPLLLDARNMDIPETPFDGPYKREKVMRIREAARAILFESGR